MQMNIPMTRKALGLRPSLLPAKARKAVRVSAATEEETPAEAPAPEPVAITKKTEKKAVPAALIYDPSQDKRFGYVPQRDRKKSDLEIEAESAGLRKINGVKKTGLWWASEQSLSYLDGSLAGDFGFDPLGIYDPEAQGGVVTQEWLRYAELIHARYAMLGAAGCIAPEFLGKVGIIPESTGLVWFKAGVIGPLSSGFEYWTDNYTIFFGQIILMQFAELRRLQDFKKPGSMKEQYFLGFEGALGGSGDPCYPGGPIFNFMHFGEENCWFPGSRTEDDLNEMKIREIKNGRMAMLAMFGYGAQAVLTGDGPFQNVLDHVSDPAHINMFGNLIS